MEQDEYLRKNFSENPGEIVDESGAIIGSHKGLFFYTTGQRKGIALAGGPYFVLAKDKNLNRLVVTKDEKKIFTKSLMVKKYNLLTADEIENGMVVEVKIRSTQKSFGAKIFKIEDGLEIRFDEPQRAVTSGQVAAFYNDDILLGGGEIE
jgi:tRNA-specific 2-thiouridylase